MNPELPLRNIHLPDAIGWWPPAPGWWISGIIVIVIITLVILWLRRRTIRLAPHKSAQLELQTIKSHFDSEQDTQQLAQELSILLRRVSMTITPRNEAAGLTGKEWLSFLDTLVDQTIFNSETGQQLITAPYQPAHAIDGQALIDLTERWLSHAYNIPRRSHA